MLPFQRQQPRHLLSYKSQRDHTSIYQLATLRCRFTKPHFCRSEFVLQNENNKTSIATLTVRSFKGTAEASFGKERLLFKASSFWSLNYNVSVVDPGHKNRYEYRENFINRKGTIELADSIYEW